jgi:DNA-binding NtrC family response regulator
MQALGRSGYRVTAFADGEEALAAFLAAPDGFDLVVSDLTMPRLGGTELARRIKEVRPEMPVIIMSGFAVHPPIADAFIEKPLLIDSLLREIAALLDREREKQ